ncbi:non-hydrolyzing UDP-N-acetylglucosamine 2-epimerase [Pseudonocardia abyssalis]|uniref:UDP-N-acetylglucosamine 2-epimerase (non-hydrolyzing) n=1 Tax=Pseudonocardia abyssalis TaxID=2792008 RepID=A0ABS6UU35_9PSEU|nr:UDP-N-acetylglucosamine 2-epimerase (non-hydrolyzing) [Pseudonocardia abyssalis]MBW0116887.1 UDP-N-acetylglucosamine 2-epimerase (non-hydrolyzing) [Pseudonocardia abyssalis]MBW0135741.1 UDP-N-acetylglucosamine 2-epimerase (non-hydrolyzing) [Pseudonocardia abyssalis]
MPPVVHLIVGTRPEAVKMAPLALALRRAGVLEPVLVATGQHPTMVAQALAAFGLEPDVVCKLHRTTGEQSELAAQLTSALDAVLAAGSAAVVVQGDTTSALVGGLVAMWRRIPVVHLEAGLRSGDLAAPFPEEANRRLLGVFADLHLAPTARAAAALRAEAAAVGAAAERVLLVGNTVVDAVLEVAAGVTAADAPAPGDPRLAAVHDAVTGGRSRLLLVTAHRRESWGAPLNNVLAATRQVVDDHPDLLCVLPAHANPAVRAQVDAALGDHPRVVVTDPLPYPELCRLLARAALVLSDSGGIQEEAPSFGVPVVVLRDVTERMEAVDAGWAQLVGTDTARIVAAAKGVLDGEHEPPRTGNPFGDGRAAERGAGAIAWILGMGDRPVDLTL